MPETARPLTLDFDPRWLRAEREAQRLSVEAIARRTGLSPSAVRTAERSRTARMSSVLLLCAALSVTEDDLRVRHGPQPDEVRFDGAALKAAREAAGLTQSQVARRAGVNVSTLRALEAGDSDPSIRVASRVVRALGLAKPQLCRFVVLRPHGAEPAAEPAPRVVVGPEVPASTAEPPPGQDAATGRVPAPSIEPPPEGGALA